MVKTLSVHSDNVKEFVEDLSNQLDQEIVCDNNEFCVELPKPYGSGTIKVTEFTEGVSVIEIDVLLEKNITINFEKKLVNPLSLIFNGESDILHSISNTNDKSKIERFENIIFSNDMNNKNSITLLKGEPISLFKITLNRELFKEKIDTFLPDLDPDIESLFRDHTGVKLFYYHGMYSLDIAEAIDDFKKCDMTALMKSIYKEGKAYEILTYQIQQYLDDLNDPKDRKILRKSSLAKIEKAAAIIENDLSNHISVIALAKEVGLNQNTLQSGFNSVYQTSVNDFIKRKRLEKAKILLESSDMNITEITYAIGINSRSYFSKLFKEAYGISPKNYYNKVKKGKSA